MQKYQNIHPETAEIISEFICDKHLARRSPRTLYNYYQYLSKFFSECPKKVQYVEPLDILNWIEKNYSERAPRTKYFVISVLSSFFTYCLAENYLDKTPIKKYWRPKLPKSLPKYLDKSDHSKVKIESLTLSLRDRTIIEFLDSSGVRRAELVSLNVSSINFTNRTASIIGKGGKERIVNFSETCGYLLEKLIKTLPHGMDAVFLNSRGNRLTPDYIYQLMRKVGQKAGLKKYLGPHVFRHTYATELAAKGADLEFISEELGHTNINTTKIYARIPSNELFNIYERYMG